MRLFTHQRSTPRPMDHRFRGRALVRSPGDPGGVSTFLRGEVITLPQAGKWKRAAYMMRLKPPPEEVWEIRCTDPRPGFEYSDGSPRRTSLLLLERSTGRCLGLPRIRRANWPWSSARPTGEISSDLADNPAWGAVSAWPRPGCARTPTTSVSRGPPRLPKPGRMIRTSISRRHHFERMTMWSCCARSPTAPTAAAFPASSSASSASSWPAERSAEASRTCDARAARTNASYLSRANEVAAPTVAAPARRVPSTGWCAGRRSRARTPGGPQPESETWRCGEHHRRRQGRCKLRTLARRLFSPDQSRRR